MNIKKVELTANGFKGANVYFLVHEFRNNRSFINEDIKRNKNPIHMDMEKLFKDIRIHLLDIFKISNNRLSEAEIKTIILETNVNSIEWDNDSFTIRGEMESFPEKYVKLNSVKVQESDEFIGYNEVRGIIEALKVEATSYIDGLKLVSDREMMLRWLEARKDNNMTKDQFELLSEEEQKNYMAKTLNSKFGAEIEIDVNEEGYEEEGSEDVVVIGEEASVVEIPEKKVKKTKEAKSPGTVTESF